MKKLFLFFLPVFLVACTNEIEVQTKPTEIKWIQPADPTPVLMNPPTWRVVTEQNVNQVLAEIGKNGNDKATAVMISTQDYQKLMIDLADLKRYIEQQKAVIIYYKNITKN